MLQRAVNNRNDKYTLLATSMTSGGGALLNFCTSKPFPTTTTTTALPVQDTADRLARSSVLDPEAKNDERAVKNENDRVATHDTQPPPPPPRLQASGAA